MESLTGPQIQALAYEQSPIEPQGLAATIQAVTIFLLVFSTIVTVVRFIIRGWKTKFELLWGVDDYLAVIALALFMAASVFILLAVRFGLGTLDKDLNPLAMIRGAEYLSYWQMTYILSTTFTKASIALALMRLSKDRRYRYPLWATIIVNFGSSAGGLIAVFSNCQPLQATWNPMLGTCGSKEKVAQISLIVSVFQIVTDWFCALCPLFILHGLQMPKHTKYSIIGLLMLGGFASIATMLRIPYFKYYTITENYLYNVGMTCLWSMVEAGVGLIACSLPSLRKLVTFYNFSYGARSRGTDTGSRSQSAVQTGSRKSERKSHHMVLLSTLDVQGKGQSALKVSNAGDWDRLDDDASSMERIVGDNGRDGARWESNGHRRDMV
ncbi:hypothetical protein PG999_002111 [Apiospora kogelbergensis]|uniref:Rhodopsin domain-containing protein n=1 Tax=Apiospora kogelbergensis TaxID=1337665 RepID=A0AAW0R7G7_9PEZI